MRDRKKTSKQKQFLLFSILQLQYSTNFIGQVTIGPPTAVITP